MILHDLYMVMAGICLAAGLVHFLIFAHRPDLKIDLVFSLLALIFALTFVLEVWMFSSASVDRYARALKINISFQGLLWIVFIWFIALYTRAARHWLVILTILFYGLAILINIVSPLGILFSAIETLDPVVLPWGERIYSAVGFANAWRIVPDIAWLLMMFLTVDSSIRMAREHGQKKEALTFGICVLLSLGLGYLQGTLIDFGVINPPYIGNFLFIALILFMSFSLSGNVVKASVLSREVQIAEFRWRSLMEKVTMLAVGLDRNGVIDYANPYFAEVSGYGLSEVIGQSFTRFVPEAQQQEILERFAKTTREGKIRAVTRLPLLAKDGTQREILWMNVLLMNNQGTQDERLSIGLDITEQIQAENARDAALQELEALKAKLEEENIYLREELDIQHGFTDIIGQSNSLLYVLTRVKQVAETDATVLIQGETGVGKELIARAMHLSSRRTANPFVRLNCAALSPNLVESELFGHERGAFTGAERLRKGRFELADGGTLLLDEISELPLDTQAKLLRVLQEGELERVGGSKTLSVNVRIVATTNRSMNEEIKEGRFRADLFYRLNVYPITVPPLRDRLGDIPLLVHHFVAQLSNKMGKKIDQVPPHVIEGLQDYAWPGNVRELRNVLEQAVIVSSDRILQLPRGFKPEKADARPEKSVNESEYAPLAVVEKDHIVKALHATGWRISGPKGAANLLGLNPSTLRFRMKKLGIGKNP